MRSAKDAPGGHILGGPGLSMPRFSHQHPQRLFLTLVSMTALAVLGGRLFHSRPVSAAAASAGPPFVEFESGHVRPLAVSPDGNTLFAVNTPNGTLEAFDLSSGTPAWTTRVPVGLEPVAVAGNPDGSEV